MRRILCLLLAVAVCLPSLFAQDEKIEVTGSRKAVRTSTDVAVIAMPWPRWASP